MKLGFIGTGTMGNPMVCCLIDAGHQLTVHDIRREATTNLCEMGATWADNAREVAAASEAVFTSLPGPTEMETTVLDPENGILAGLPTGGAYIDMTTNSPTVFRRVAEACLSRGIDVLDAPVSGRPPRMTVMAGGDAAIRILGIEEDTVTRHIKMACERYDVNKRTLLAVRTLFDGTLSFSEIVARRYTPFRE